MCGALSGITKHHQVTLQLHALMWLVQLNSNILGRLIGLCTYCRHLCRCSSPALPKCCTRHNGCYVLQQICLWVSQIRIYICTNANTGLITSVQLTQLINTANWLSIVIPKPFARARNVLDVSSIINAQRNGNARKTLLKIDKAKRYWKLTNIRY